MSRDSCADLKKYKETIRSSDSRIAALGGERNQLLKQLKLKCGTSNVGKARAILKEKQASLEERESAVGTLQEKASGMADKLGKWADGEEEE